MKDSKLIEIIRTFSKSEMKSFEKFIASPYFARGRDVTGLFNLIYKYHPELDSPALEKSAVFKKLFPKEKFNEKKLKNITFDLTRLAEQFLIHNYITEDEITADKFLATQYKDRKVDKLFFSTMKTLEKKLDDQLIDEYKALRNTEESVQMKAHYYFWKNDFDNTIVNELKYIEYFTLSFIMRFFKKLQSRQIITSRYNKEFDSPLFESMRESIDVEKLIEKLRERNYSYLWLIEIYYNAYKCTVNNIDNQQNFRRLKELFYEHINKFTEPERQGLFIDLTHYCVIQKDEKGNWEYEREQFEIYKKIIENFSPKNDFFNIVLYRSIISTGLALNEYDWVENFSNEYTNTLKAEHRSNMENYVKAQLAFARKDFTASLEYLSKISYDMFLYKIDVKNLLLKNYYELDLFEQAFSLIDAYKHFLIETKEYGPLQIKNYTKFINLYSKLVKIKESRKYDSLEVFIKNPDYIDGTHAYKWIRAKVDELKAK